MADAYARERDRPIADYGLIGDCASAALVASDGGIDWWCPPRFDAPPVFAAILDRAKGGTFRVHGARGESSATAYLDRTNVLRTEFHAEDGAFELLDFMPFDGRRGPVQPTLVRIARALEGEPRVRVEFAPRFDFGRVVPRFSTAPDGRVLARGAGRTLSLAATGLDVSVEGRGAVATGRLAAGRSATLVLGYHGFERVDPPPNDVLDSERALGETVEAWREWAGAHAYRGEYAGPVMRSALVLKLLTYAPTGAVVAAPTCSLPEWIGGVRNWDYRYAWVRDAVFSVRALSEVGHADEAERLVDWIVRVADPDPAKLRVLYSVTGDLLAPERELEGVAGYRNSLPVRVGNAAHEQFQLDVYGELFEGAHACGLLAKDGAEHRWRWFRALAEFVADNWRRPDCGIWEVRSAPRHFVLSKAMAWAALDRAASVVEDRGFDGDADRWRREADACRAEALDRGWSEPLGAFQQAYDTPVLDASNLLLPIIGFVDARDERMLRTVDATRSGLTVNGLVYRYLGADDGLPGGEATFTYCTFWLVEVLAMQGRLEEAREILDGVLARASPLGLFAEELHPTTGEHLGNYPQGFPHIGLIRAAVRLSKAVGAAPATPPLVMPPG